MKCARRRRYVARPDVSRARRVSRRRHVLPEGVQPITGAPAKRSSNSGREDPGSAIATAGTRWARDVGSRGADRGGVCCSSPYRRRWDHEPEQLHFDSRTASAGSTRPSPDGSRTSPRGTSTRSLGSRSSDFGRTPKVNLAAATTGRKRASTYGSARGSAPRGVGQGPTDGARRRRGPRTTPEDLGATLYHAEQPLDKPNNPDGRPTDHYDGRPIRDTGLIELRCGRRSG